LSKYLVKWQISVAVIDLVAFLRGMKLQLANKQSQRREMCTEKKILTLGLQNC